MDRTSVDTNVLLRLTLKDVPDQHERAAALFRAMPRVVVGDAALVEYVFVLEDYYELPRAQVAEMVRGVMRLPGVECSSALIDRALSGWQVHPELSFEDCYMAERALADDAAPLWTFDKKLARQHPGAQEVPETPDPADPAG